MWEQFAIIAGRCFAGIIGFLLLYSSIFLYEDEEGTLLNWLDELWKRIRQAHSSSISRGTALVKSALSLISNQIDKLFGQKLFTWKAVSLSISFSMSSLIYALTVLAVVAYFTDPPPDGNLTISGCLLAICTLIVGGLTGTVFLSAGLKYEKGGWINGAIRYFIIACAIWIDYEFGVLNGSVRHGPPSATGFWTAVIVLPFVSIGSDFLFIAITRSLIKKCSNLNSMFSILGLLGGNILIGITLVLTPLTFEPLLNAISKVGTLDVDACIMTNSVDLIIVIGIFLLAIMMVFHRLFWPILERPIYATRRYKLFVEQKKMTFCAGAALVVIAIPKLGHLFNKIIDSLHL